jgi:hypothetical protein
MRRCTICLALALSVALVGCAAPHYIVHELLKGDFYYITWRLVA